MIEKWDQTDSPEIPDRGKTSEIPPASLRGRVAERQTLRVRQADKYTHTDNLPRLR